MPDRLDVVFGALANGTRRAIVQRLAGGPASVTDLAAPFAMSLPAISKHLRVLEDAGLMARRIEGRVHHCRLVSAPMSDAAAWLDRNRRLWEASFDALDAYLKETAPPPRRRAARGKRKRP